MAKPRRLPNTTVRKHFGERVREVRQSKKLTLEDLAEKAEMNWSYIAQVERGERNISLDNMTAIAEGLSVPLRELL